MQIVIYSIHDNIYTGSSSGHGNELNQYSGVLPPVTLGNSFGFIATQ